MTNDLIDHVSIENQRIAADCRLHWFHWLIVALSLVLTITAWSISKNSLKEKVALQFDREAQHVVELIIERMGTYEDGLWSGVAAIKANGGTISYHQWKTFANSLRIDIKYPGINGIGVIHYVAPEAKASYLAEQRKSRPDYHIHPAHSKNEFWPITYIEPVAPNASAVGLDMAHERNRYTAGLRARETGTAQITGPITLVQDETKTAGFLFYAPFYKGTINDTSEARRQQFVGMVYAPFVVNKLMAGTLQREKRHVGVKISDGHEVLYDEHSRKVVDYDPNSQFTRQFEVDLYGRTWNFDIRSTHAFRKATNSHQPIIILVGGVIIDTLLLTLFVLLTNANRRALDLINQMSVRKVE